MERVVHFIARPTRSLLIVFSVVLFVILTAVVWWFSFSWELVFSVTYYMIWLLILFTIGFIVSLVIDNSFQAQLKKYFVIAVAELLLIWAVSNPIRTWQINASFAQAKAISESLKNFKSRFGTYPASLTELEKKLNLDLPDLTYLGTVYKYEQMGINDYRLWFQSYYGYTASYNKDYDNWRLSD